MSMKKFLEYLGRYTHRVAISNYRIKSFENGKVVFTWRDRAENNALKEMTLDAVEFIRRFILHVFAQRVQKDPAFRLFIPQIQNPKYKINPATGR